MTARRLVVGVLLALAGAGSTLLVGRHHVVAVRVVGGSMEPQLRAGQLVLCRRIVHDAGRRRSGVRAGVGDVVLLTAPSMATRADSGTHLRVKRVVAVSGDSMPMSMRRFGDVVPAGEVVVVGDHRLSEDSRRWGPIPTVSVRAKVVWPRV